MNALSAGTNHDAETTLSGDLIEWADEIYCMERSHYRKLQRGFASMLTGKPVRVLGIPDNYAYMDPALVAVITAKFVRWFG
ncbi:MAG: phosphotyrosine protein phosphatase [Sphingorhabdus sp.]